MNLSEHTEYIFIPENKEGLRDCRPCILISDFNVSTFSYSMLNKITSLYLFGKLWTFFGEFEQIFISLDTVRPIFGQVCTDFNKFGHI